MEFSTKDWTRPPRPPRERSDRGYAYTRLLHPPPALYYLPPTFLTSLSFLFPLDPPVDAVMTAVVEVAVAVTVVVALPEALLANVMIAVDALPLDTVDALLPLLPTDLDAIDKTPTIAVVREVSSVAMTAVTNAAMTAPAMMATLAAIMIAAMTEVPADTMTAAMTATTAVTTVITTKSTKKKALSACYMAVAQFVSRNVVLQIPILSNLEFLR